MISQTLIAAKAELLRRGWCQGTYENRATGEVCLGGAIFKATGDSAEWCEAVAVVQDVLQLRQPDAYNPVIAWNDRPGRQPEEVLRVLDIAIARAVQLETQAAELVQA